MGTRDNPRSRPLATAGPAGGFTLVEVLIASVLVVLAFVALVAAFGYEGLVIQRGEEITYGTFLANEIHDKALRMDFADLFDLDGAAYDPAILSTDTTQDRDEFAQQVAVTPVDATDLGVEVEQSGAQAACLTVTVTVHGKPVVQQAYHIFDLSDVPFTDRDVQPDDDGDEGGSEDDPGEDDDDSDDSDNDNSDNSDGDNDDDDDDGGWWDWWDWLWG